jgi:PAS domain S-box-containing protein
MKKTQTMYEMTQKMGRIGSWELDLVTNQLIWSDEIYRIFGIKPRSVEAINERYLEVIHPDDRELVHRAYVQSLEQGTAAYEIEHRIIRQNDNAVRVVHARCEHVMNDSGTVIRSIGMIQDITERKQLEEALREREQYLRTILETTQDGFWIVDGRGRFTDVNESYTRMSGYTRKELLSMGVGDVEAIETPDETADRIRRIRTQGHDLFDTRHKRKDGSIIDVEVSVMLLDRESGSMVCFCRDITDRRKAEAAIRFETQFQQLIAEISTDFLTANRSNYDKKVNTMLEKIGRFFDVDRTYLVQVSRQGQTLTNTHEWCAPGVESLIHMVQFYPLKKLPYVKKMILNNEILSVPDVNQLPEEASAEREIYGKLGIKAILVIPIMKDQQCTGRIRFDMVRSTREWQSRHMGYMKVLANMLAETQAKMEAEEALLSTNRQLEEAIQQAEKANNAKSQFLASMSHEIRTPMNGMMGMLQLMQYTTLTEEQKEYLEAAQYASETLLHLINNILDYSRIEAGKTILEKHLFDLRDLMDEIIAIFEPMAADKGLTLHFETAADIPQLLAGDSHRLKQVLNNLLNNAFKFTKEGGITVKVEKVREEGQMIELFWQVKDSGIGIPETQLNYVFEIFTQADSAITRKYGGSGLGLAICKSIVEQMNGKIWANSHDGNGSEFYFTCEMGKAETVTVDRESIKSPGNNRKHKHLHLLVVDDDTKSCMLIQKIAQKNGWTIVLAHSGREAISEYEQHTFDVVLMDIQMPDMDGYETTSRLRSLEDARRKSTPIIAVTANALPRDQEKCLEAGMNDYIAKPFTVNQLLDTIDQWT